MKKKNLLFCLLTTIAIGSGLTANAQFGGLLQKAKDKAAQKASDAMDKKTAASTDGSARKSSRLVINSDFDFVAGDSILFTEDFANVAKGTTARSFKTNGSASVVTVNGESGKWLTLAQSATYKLTKQIFYPKHFTVEFDILAAADQVRDINPVYIGFVKDNSVAEYNSGEGARVSLMYYNTDEVSIYSSYISKSLSTKFDLPSYINRRMHVSLVVDGERMVVYLDKTKLADTQVFLPGNSKNFYISAPLHYDNGSNVLVSNFRIATFKKN